MDRTMANMKFFATVAGQVVELESIWWENNKTALGIPKGTKRVWDGKRWTGDIKAERVIQFKSNPSLHQCDARCMNAKGRICECSCRGKNHGNGGSALSCEAA